MSAFHPVRSAAILIILAILAACVGDGARHAPRPRPAAIVVSGRAVPVGGGVRVVRWFDPGGLDAYHGAASPNFGVRENESAVDQIVVHYDAVGDSRQCFVVLQRRGLSAHFLIDRDGTIYQTLDVRERAYHATIANDRSVGVEIAHEGAFPAKDPPAGAPPPAASDIVGVVQGQRLRQRPFTDAQYQALAQLVAALRRPFPRVALAVPRDADGRVAASQLHRGALARFRGLLGHHHVQSNKIDPGPAFDWDRLLRHAHAAEQPPCLAK